MSRLGNWSASAQSRVAIIGGGLAGLAAAEALARSGSTLPITLFESRRVSGGRAGSFVDPASGDMVDYCQHVAMGCCRELLALLDRCGLSEHWQRYSQFTFHHRSAGPSQVAASRWWPAPFHLLGSLRRMRYLSAAQRRQIRQGIWRLMRTPTSQLGQFTARRWLQRYGQSDDTIAQWWDVVIVSALGESSRSVSMAAARKVFVDGFLAARDACDVLIPTLPLSDLFGARLAAELRRLGVQLRLAEPVRCIALDGDGPGDSLLVETASGRQRFEQVVLAVPWHQLGRLVDPPLAARAGLQTDIWSRFPGSPISGIHLWFDQPITDAAHGVLVGSMAQWLFRRDPTAAPASRPAAAPARWHYYQVVISASRDIKAMPREDVLRTIVAELAVAFPAARQAKLLASRIVTDPQAVFSITPQVEAARPTSATALPNLHLAGDFVQTGWPATMEGAVVSGRAAARGVLAWCNRGGAVPTASSAQSRLSRWLIRD